VPNRIDFDQQMVRMRKLREITEAATQAIAGGKHVNEIEILAAWNQVSTGVPLPGKTVDEPPTRDEILANALVEITRLIVAQGAQQATDQSAQQSSPEQEPQPSSGQTPSPAHPNAKPSTQGRPQPPPGRPSPWEPDR